MLLSPITNFGRGPSDLFKIQGTGQRNSELARRRIQLYLSSNVHVHPVIAQYTGRRSFGNISSTSHWGAIPESFQLRLKVPSSQEK